MDYGLRQHILYRIPATAVSYHPELANVRVWWTGKYVNRMGTTFAEFRFANEQHTWHGDSTLLLRPFAVVTHP